MRKYYSISTAALLLILAVLLVACGGGQQPTATPEPTNTPAPTNTPRPTNTPEPTVDVESLSVADLQATKTAVEEDLADVESRAAGASASEEGSYEFEIDQLEKEIEELDALIEAAGGSEAAPEGDSEETAAAEDTSEAEDMTGDESAMTAVTLTLSGDFEEVREWTWDELEALEMITATVAGPREEDPETEYTGVSLMAFLDAAGVGDDAGTLVATASDDFAAEIDLAAAKTCEECMIVLEDDSLRLIMPEFPSNNWVTALVSLEAK